MSKIDLDRARKIADSKDARPIDLRDAIHALAAEVERLRETPNLDALAEQMPESKEHLAQLALLNKVMAKEADIMDTHVWKETNEERLRAIEAEYVAKHKATELKKDLRESRSKELLGWVQAKENYRRMKEAEKARDEVLQAHTSIRKCTLPSDQFCKWDSNCQREMPNTR